MNVSHFVADSKAYKSDKKLQTNTIFHPIPENRAKVNAVPANPYLSILVFEFNDL